MPALVALLAVATVLLWEGVSAKTGMAETRPLAVAVVLLIPLLNAKSVPDVVLDGAIWWCILPLVLIAALHILHPLAVDPLVPDRGAGVVRGAAYLAMICVAFVSGAVIARDGRRHRWLSLCLLGLVLAGAAWTYTFNLEARYGFAATKNTVSGVIAHLAFLSLIVLMTGKTGGRALATLIALLVLVIALILSHRVLAFASVVFLIVFHVLACFRPGTVFLLALFLLLASAGYAAILAIANLPRAEGISDLNALFVDLTGRRLTSGREEHWAQILHYLQLRPWLGLGPAVLPRDLFATELASAHNSFLTLALQLGLSGLVLLAVQVLALLLGIGRSTSRTAGAIGVGYLCFVVVHASFESFLTANNFPIAAIVWINLGLLWSWSRQGRGHAASGMLPQR